MKKNKDIKYNIVFNIILQIITIIYGFLIPKLILSYFGSEINGLVSSITQLLGFVSLLEGGVTAIVISKLYKPLVNHDHDTISSIYVTSNSFYKKIGFCFIIFSVLLGILYPMFINVPFSRTYIFSLTIIISIGMLIQYMFSISLRCILVADKKIYIVSIAQMCLYILNIIFGTVSLFIFPNIHLFKFICSITFIFQSLIFNYYIKKHYNINKKAKKNNQLIKERWYGFFNNLAFFVNTSTDVTVLTLFTNLSMVSVYSVYSLVTNGIKSFVNAIISGISPSIGQSYSKDSIELFNEKFDYFEYINFSVIFVLLNVAFVLITPFVNLYTKNIHDISYYYPIFGYLIVLSCVVELLKYPYTFLAYCDNKFKKMAIPSFLEAFINIAISLLLVAKYGLIGVAIGTIFGGIYRFIFQLRLTNKISGRNIKKTLYKIFIFIFFSVVGFIICGNFMTKKITIIMFILLGLLFTFIYLILLVILSKLFFKKEFNNLIKYLNKEDSKND